MTNPTALLRSVVISAICVPVAIILGYTLAGPLNYGFVIVLGSCIMALLMPTLLRIHHPLLLLSWNATMIVFFLPGNPGAWMPLVAFSLLISVVQRTIDRDFRFISVPSLTWPLLIMAAVVLVTAEGRGGIKLRSMGGEFYGGKHYLITLVAIVGYFALTAQKIPRERAKLYAALFLLGGITTLIGDVFFFQSKALQWIYWLFPPNTASVEARSGLTRLYGVDWAALVLAYYMMAKYGIRGLFSFKSPWRLALFAILSATSLLGGFRSFLFNLALCFGIQFCLEGLHRTKLLFVLIIGLALTATVSLPFVRMFPYSIQRSLSFLPVDTDPMVKADAEASAVWRFELWHAVLPEVPQYFWFGKGYVFTPRDFDYALNNYLGSQKNFSEEDSWAALAGDYHNGPLSVIIPFGVWGALAFLWFISVGTRVLYRNWKYGDPDLKIINAFLFAGFAAHILMFMAIFGAFDNDMHFFVGYLGLGVALNGGMVARPAPEPVRPKTMEIPVRSRLEPAFQRARYRE